jgi:hypothetical protein
MESIPLVQKSLETEEIKATLHSEVKFIRKNEILGNAVNTGGVCQGSRVPGRSNLVVPCTIKLGTPRQLSNLVSSSSFTT